jgi:hypothetical protein
LHETRSVSQIGQGTPIFSPKITSIVTYHIIITNLEITIN